MTLNYKKIAKLKVAEVMKDLPTELKDPACYKEITRKLGLVMLSDHTHKNIKEFTNCKRCHTKHSKRRELIKEFGFKSIEQYMGWQRVMDIIVNQKAIKISNKFVK